MSGGLVAEKRRDTRSSAAAAGPAQRRPRQSSKVFVEDLGADGLRAKRSENQPFDSYEAAGTHIAFDGNPRRQRLSEEEYMKTFSAADERYSHMLTQLKKNP